MGDDELGLLLRAAGLFHRLGDEAQEAMARYQTGCMLAGADRWGEAVDQFRRAADLFARLGHPAQEGAARMMHGGSLSHLDRDEESLPEFARAVALLESAGDDHTIVGAEVSWLLALVELERWDEALERCTRIERLTADAGDSEPLLHSRLGARYHRARISTIRGDHDGFLEAAPEAAALADRLGERPTARQTWAGIAALRRKREDYIGAEPAFRRALANIDPGQADASALEAWCRFGIAECLDETRPAGDNKECIEQALLAAQWYDELDLPADAAAAYYLATRHRVLKAYPEVELRPQAAETALTAADRFEAAGDYWGKGLAEGQAAFILLPADPDDPRDPRVVSLERRAAASFERAGRLAEGASARLSVAMELTIEKRPGWLRHGLFALSCYERARASSVIPHQSVRRSSDQRIAQGLMLLTVNAARAAASLASRPEWRELVWRLEQATKARMFQDQRADPRAWDALVEADERTRALDGRVQQLGREVDRVQGMIDRHLAAGEMPRALELAEELSRSKAELDAANRELGRHVSRREADQSVAAALASVPPVRPEDVRAVLRPGEAFVGYLWPEDNLLRTIVTRDAGLSVEALRVSAAGPGGLSGWADNQRRQALRSMQRLDDDDVAADAGDDATVVGELLAGLPPRTRTLFLSPAGPLLGVPWHDLPLPGIPARLGDALQIGIVPSAGVLVQLRRSPAAAVAEAPYLGVACDPGDLPGTDDMVRRLAREHFGDTTSAACLTTLDCGRFFELRRKVYLLHLACHAGRGGLRLSTSDEWTTPLGLAGISVRADVLLLTACSAGSFGTGEDNEFLGVVRQLLVATGAKAAVVSAVPVSNGAALLFSDLLLGALISRVPLGHAVATARMQMARMDAGEVRAFIGASGVSPLIHESWWRPWFVVGDAGLEIAMEKVHGDPARSPDA